MSQEIEAKFAVVHLADLRSRVLHKGGHLRRDRHLERNWRLDTTAGVLTANQQVLRVRAAERVLLTYKRSSGDPISREEFEVEVGDARTIRQILNALGFHERLIYEKYREVFELHGAEVVLDELPFGCFVEIEANSRERIKAVAEALDLDWSARVPASYLDLFERAKELGSVEAQHATFAEFSGVPRLLPNDLGLPAATSHKPVDKETPRD